MADDADEPLPAEAAAVLSQWATSDPPPGFVDRVIAAAQLPAAQPDRPPARPVRRWWWVGAAFVAAAAVAGSLMPLGRGGSADEGARVVRERETIRLGERGVAVAEADTELAWAIAADGAAEVHQSSGDVFYRVERGGPFVVETPYGRVIVHGTCFRVEVLNMNASRQTWVGGVVGAALAATVVIAVYEGRVRVVNARGQADARAGDRIALGAGAAPARIEGGASEAAIAALEPPPTGSISMPELLRRDQSHRGEIALLRARVRALETTAGPAPDAPAVANHRDGKRKTFDLSQEELVDMAKNCEIRYDVPGYGLEPRLMTDKLAAATHLSADERAVYDQTVRKENDRYMTALRGLYQELTGGDPDTLEPSALFTEILRKSPTADVIAARKRLAAERAGLAPPPADARGQSVIERLFRLQSAAGSSLEQMLAAELGPDKAHQIRQGGWAGGDDAILYSCDD